MIIHTRVGRTRFGTVESAFDEDFRRLMADDFMFVGQGEAALMYVRSIMNTRGKVPRSKRRAHLLQQACVRYTEQLHDTVWNYPVGKLGEMYNGNGNKGTGGPPVGMLCLACDEYIKQHHPRLRQTRVMRRFEELG